MKSRIQIAFILLVSMLLFVSSFGFYILGLTKIEKNELEKLHDYAQIIAGLGTEVASSNLPDGPQFKGIQFFRLDPAGVIRSTSLSANTDLLANPSISEFIRDQEGSGRLAINGASYFAAITATKTADIVVLIEPTTQIKKAVDELRNQILLRVAVLFLLGWFATWLSSKRLIRPIEELAETTDEMIQGDFSQRIRLNDLEELTPMAINFNKMADLLEITSSDSLSNQNQLQAILGSMNSGVIAVDARGKILIFNAFAREAFGITTEPIGKDIRGVIRSEDMERIMSVSDEFQELSLRHAPNTVVRFKTTELSNKRNTEKGRVTVIQDVTDLKRLEQMRSQFVANVSHELKTPLTSIKGFAETLRDVEDPAVRNKFLDIIDNEAERLSRLIEDILSLSSIESHETHSTELIDMTEVTTDALRLLDVQAQSKNVHLTLEIKGDPVFFGEREMYRELIINLVDNAIKYTEAQGQVMVGIEEQGAHILITVKDTGVGIPAEHLSRLFERFYRVDISRDRAKGGTGLGLAIVKHITIAFGGSIQVESKEGEGTTFTVRLPAQHESHQKPDQEIHRIIIND